MRTFFFAALISALAFAPATPVFAQDKKAPAKAATSQAPVVPATAPPAGSAAPAPPQGQGAPQIPWLVNCASVSGQMACEAIQRLVIQKTGQLLLSVTVRIPPQSTNPVMMLHLPHGLFLPDGVSLDVDGKSPKTHEVQTCDQKGCYVGLALDGDTLKSLQTGQAMTIAFHNLQKEPVRIAVLLSGFGAAYKKLQQ